jgi:uncharacterized protein (TIGR03437 family)
LRAVDTWGDAGIKIRNTATELTSCGRLQEETLKKLAWALLIGWPVLYADTQSIRVLNAASFLGNPGVAPGAIVAIIGTNLANTTAAAPDPSNPPTALGGVTVNIGSTAAALYYVTPGQINARIDPAIPPGTYPLTIKSPTGTFNTQVVVSANANPGIFSLFGSGTRDGAIENAVTYALGPFTVTTKGGPTYLALYTTGLDLSTKPTVTVGGVIVPVQFYGTAPCCPALQQVNVQLPPALAGAGRVEIAITSNGVTSNLVEVMVLPNPGQGPLPPSGENQPRSREISSVAYVPGTSLGLVADESDDVVRFIDVKQLRVIHTITLAEGAQPVAIAVNGPGTLAVVAERDRGKVAIVDVVNRVVSREVAVGGGPTSVVIAGTTALVVNQDSDTLSVVDLNTYQVNTVNVGRGPRAVAADAAGNKAYVTNEADGTLSVIDLTKIGATPATINLPAGTRPAEIALLPSLGVLAIGVPSAASGGQQGFLVSLADGSIRWNSTRSSGPTGLAVYTSTLYFANPASGAVTIAPITGNGGFAPTTLPVDLGPRGLAVDTEDNALLVAHEGSGTIVLVDLTTNQIRGRINAVQSEQETSGQNLNNHNDRLIAANAPAITSLSVTNARANSSFALTISGKNLQDADNIFFVNPSTLPGQGSGSGQVENDEHVHTPFGTPDTHVTVSNIFVNGAGTQLTANITIAGDTGGVQRVVRVETPNGDTSWTASAANTFQIN